MNLNQIHAKEMSFRAAMDAFTLWKTPESINCLRYAASEANEARQAWMDKALGDPRNNQGKAEERKKEGSVQRELAETAFMLMAALGSDVVYEEGYEPWLTHEREDLYIDLICHEAEVLIATIRLNDDIDWWKSDAINVICMIDKFPGVDLEEQQALWHHKIWNKHGASIPEFSLPQDVDIQ